MKTVNYVPSVCKTTKDKDGNDIVPSFVGHIELRVLSFDEKFDLLESAGIELDEQNKVKFGDGNKLKSARKMVKASEPYYVSVSLKRISDGAEFKTFEDMTFESELHATLQEVAGDIISGLKVGKN